MKVRTKDSEIITDVTGKTIIIKITVNGNYYKYDWQ